LEPKDLWQHDDDLAGAGPDGYVSIPAYQSGGRVERTGIALVHEGEYIVPAPGSEAVIGAEAFTGGQVIHYHFPVEVEVIGDLGESQIRRVADQVYRELNDALASRI
jgi:hypothetical protein